MKKPKRINPKRFVSAFSRYVNFKGGCASASGILGIPRPYVFRWSEGKILPSKKYLSSICAKVGWDENYFFDFSPGDPASLPSFDLDKLNVEFINAVTEDPKTSLVFITMAGAAAYHYLLSLGVEATLHADQLQSYIRLQASHLLGCYISISGSMSLGLSTQFHFEEPGVTLDPRPQHLSKSILDFYRDTINKLPKEKNGTK